MSEAAVWPGDLPDLERSINLNNPHAVTEIFETHVARYVGAPYCAAVNSCTAALLLAVAWHLRNHNEDRRLTLRDMEYPGKVELAPRISIPRPGYISVPQSIIHAGGRPVFRDEDWSGAYQLQPYPIWDSARRFTSNMYRPGQFQCVSFHASKILGLEQGGAILHDDPAADKWFRRARFDGRTPGVHPKDDVFDFVGWHCYMNPSTAAQGLLRIYSLAKDNEDLPNDDYPDLATLEIFK